MLRAYFQSIYSSCDVFTFGTILMAGSYLYTFNCDSNKHIVGYTQILETIMKLMLQNKYEVSILSTVLIMVLMICRYLRCEIYLVSSSALFITCLEETANKQIEEIAFSYSLPNVAKEVDTQSNALPTMSIKWMNV